jgi:hypothetical protein
MGRGRTTRGAALRFSILCLAVWASAASVDRPPTMVDPIGLDVFSAAIFCATIAFVWSAVDNTTRSLGSAARLWAAPVLASLTVLATIGRGAQVGRSDVWELVASSSAFWTLIAVALGFAAGSVGHYFFTSRADS